MIVPQARAPAAGRRPSAGYFAGNTASTPSSYSNGTRNFACWVALAFRATA